MIVRTIDEIVGTDRVVDAPTFVSHRLLLARDGTDFSMHHTVLAQGSVTVMQYRHHVEAVLCIEGRGELTDLATGQSWDVRPGLLYLLDGHERHELRAVTELRTVCVFTPPLVGPEVHDSHGCYPLLGSTTEDRYPTRLSHKPSVLPRADPVVHGSLPGPLTAEQIGSFASEGFVQLPGVFDPEEVAGFRAELTELAARQDLRESGRTIIEPGGDGVRSVFEVHRVSELFSRLAADPRVVGIARQLLGGPVYVHQSRVNYKPAFGGEGFYWHSDFETWHAEDGMPAMRAASFSISLTPNRADNGPLMIMPGSHLWFVSCVGATPPDHYRDSLRTQKIGTPDPESLSGLAEQAGIRTFTGDAGAMTVFDSNCMHGSANNISTSPRSNVFFVFNSVENTLVEPFAALAPRPTFVASRDFTPMG